MSKKKNVAKQQSRKLSFRQRLRLQSAERLDVIAADVRLAVEDSLKSVKTSLHPDLVTQLCCGGQTKTLREQLITQLANEVENELEALYNKQLDLMPGDTHVVEA